MTQLYAPGSGASLFLVILGQRVRIRCADVRAREILAANFEAMLVRDPGMAADLDYSVAHGVGGRTATVVRDGTDGIECEGPDELVHCLEQDLVVELQRRRRELLFLHSAAVEWRGRAWLLVAESGSGKSTITWGLLHHGFGYLSDELAPVDLASMSVLPYAHALNVKQAPAAPYALPAEAMNLGRTIHVPVRHLPSRAVHACAPLGAVFMLTHRPGLSAPAIRALETPAASVHLYVNTLNALAHPNHGLDAVVHIAQNVPVYAVGTTDLARSSAAITRLAEAVVDRPQPTRSTNA